MSDEDSIRDWCFLCQTDDAEQGGLFYAYPAGKYKDLTEAFEDAEIKEMIYRSDGYSAYVLIDPSLIRTLKRNISTPIPDWINEAVRERLKTKKIEEIT